MDNGTEGYRVIMEGTYVFCYSTPKELFSFGGKFSFMRRAKGHVSTREGNVLPGLTETSDPGSGTWIFHPGLSISSEDENV